MTGVEEVVLLDEDGVAIGTTAKATVHHTDTPLHLAFSCYVLDEGGRVLVTQRATHKPTWGGVWTNSYCGHPAPGEALDDAVRRRAPQEIGCAVDDVRLVLPTFRYRAVMERTGVVEHEMCPVFTARVAGDVAPDAAEVDGHAWVPWAEFRDRALAPASDLSPWAREQVAALPEDPWASAPGDPALLPPAAWLARR